MSVLMTSGRNIGVSLLLTCLNMLVGAMLMSLGLLLALALSVQARCSRPEAEALRQRIIPAKRPD